MSATDHLEQQARIPNVSAERDVRCRLIVLKCILDAPIGFYNTADAHYTDLEMSGGGSSGNGNYQFLPGTQQQQGQGTGYVTLPTNSTNGGTNDYTEIKLK